MTLAFKGLLSFLILHELNKKQLYGEELAQKIGLRRGTPLTAGTIYPTLKRLHKQKLLTRKKIGREKYYSLTKKGTQELEEQYKLFGQYFRGLKSKIPGRK